MNRFSAIRVLLMLALASSLALTACAAPEAEEAATSAAERVRVSGSGTALPLVRILTNEYEADSEDIEFVYLPGLHSGGGIRGVANGDLEIGAVSRLLTEEESALGLDYTHLADDGLVVAVHPTVTIDGLTSQQVRDIYAGKHENWSELGGPDLPIVILDRNEDESAKIILREYVLGPDMAITPSAVNLFYEPDMVEGLRDTPGAIGYFSLGYGLSADVAVNYLALDGIEASVENINSGTYPVIRPLGVVTAKDPGTETAEFLEWALSPDAVELIESRGFARPAAQAE